MPAENRVWSKYSPDLVQQLPTWNLAFHRQATTLIVGEQNPLLTVRLPQDPVLCNEVLDHELLLAMDPASENYEVKLPGLERKTHGTANRMKKLKSSSLSRTIGLKSIVQL